MAFNMVVKRAVSKTKAAPAAPIPLVNLADLLGGRAILAHYDASKGITSDVDGKVSVIADQSAYARHLSQYSAAYQPRLIQDVDGYDAIELQYPCFMNGGLFSLTNNTVIAILRANPIAANSTAHPMLDHMIRENLATSNDFGYGSVAGTITSKYYRNNAVGGIVDTAGSVTSYPNNPNVVPNISKHYITTNSISGTTVSGGVVGSKGSSITSSQVYRPQYANSGFISSSTAFRGIGATTRNYVTDVRTPNISAGYIYLRELIIIGGSLTSTEILTLSDHLKSKYKA